jgi:hypothetical protein
MAALRKIQTSVDVRSFWWAVGLSVVGCFMLVAAMFIPPKAIIDASIISAAGLLFAFSGAIVGINGNLNNKLMKFESDFTQKIKAEEEKDDENISNS